MRTTGIGIALAAALVAGLAVAGGPAGATTAGRFDSCPAAIPLVNDSTVWLHHKLAPGVTLAETTARGGRGRVNIDVVRVDLNRPDVAVKPLHHVLTQRDYLTTLAKHAKLVAATNGMYFNLGYGAPKVPFIAAGRALVMSSTPEHVAGIGTDGRAQDGDVWLAGIVHSTGTSYPLAGLNEPTLSTGLNFYSDAWGHHKVPMSSTAEARGVLDGVVVTGTSQHAWAPPGGQIIVAKGADAVQWLANLQRGVKLRVSRTIDTDAREPFTQAYGVGTQTVAAPGEALSGLYCATSNPFAARTAIAWKLGGHKLMLVTVESPKGSGSYGLDENQMSGLLVSLGASRGFALDGGSSTQLVARLKTRITKHVTRRVHHHVVHRVVHRVVKRLALHVSAPHTIGRAIPVGVGIYSTR